MRKKLAYLLSLIITLSMLLPQSSYSAYTTAQISHFQKYGHYEHYDECKIAPELYSEAYQNMYNAIKDELPTITENGVAKPMPPRNKKGQPLNFKLWHDKHIAVYGNWSKVGANDFDDLTQVAPGKIEENEGYYRKGGLLGEYRYHGFDYIGNKFTNINFRDDDNLGIALSKKDWIITPWKNSNINVIRSSYTRSAEFGNATTQNWISKAVSFTLDNYKPVPLSTNPNTLVNNYAWQYMHIMQAPTLQYPGQGRMWHLHKGSIWYQTFPIPILSDIPMPGSQDITVTLTLLNKPEEFVFIDYGASTDSEKINVKAKLIAVLNDGEYIKDQVEKTNRYTREDIKNWELEINGQKKTVQSKTPNSAEATFTFPLTKAQIKGLANKTYHLAGKGKVIFVDGKSAQEDSNSKDAVFSWTKKKIPDMEVNLTINNPASDFIIKSGTPDSAKVTLKADVTAKLLDEAYYNSQTLKMQYNTRYDLKECKMSMDSTLVDTNQTVIKFDKNIAKATFNITLTVGQIKKLASYKYEFRVNGQDFFKDGSATQQRGDYEYRTFTFENLPTPPPTPTPAPTQEPVVTPEPTPEIIIIPQEPAELLPDPIVPEIAFDIIDFEATDNTDMSNITSRQVYINDVPVDDNLFFSGGFKFGEGSEGLKQVRIDYTSSEGLSGQAIEWVMVYSTKPKAQFKLDGSYKQRRKLTVTNTSESANDQIVLDRYPITTYEWSYDTVEGNPDSMRIRGTETDLLKEIMYKEPGVYKITLTATNTLDRVSTPYELQFVVYEDIRPALEICLNNSVLARNESIGAYHYSVSSTDGDVITTNTLELWYDSNNDGTYDQLVNTSNGRDGFPTYTPTKLGKYKYINKVSEDYGQETLQEFITAEDKLTRTEETEFLVDNYIPMTDVYTDIPIVRPEVDVYFMLDANLDTNKTAYVLNGRMDFNNQLRTVNILPTVNNWDMRTYTYSMPASTSKYTGTSYPSDTEYYSSGGYSGTLSRSSVTNNKYQHDFGSNQTLTESRTFSASGSNTETLYYGPGGKYDRTTFSWDNSNSHPTYPINQDGYAGSIPAVSGSYKKDGPYKSTVAKDGSYTVSYYHSIQYSGTLTKSVTVWVPDWRWVDDYTGFYSGTIYKYVRQPYVDPFRPTSKKYIIYVSDSNVSELNDLQMVRSKTDAKLILIGQDSIRSQVSHDKFILNNRPIDAIVQEALEYISGESPPTSKFYVLAGQDTFTLNTADYDEENDPIVEQKFQYVQNQNYFDNPMGMESFTADTYSDSGNWVDTKATKFNKTGEYHIYRRIKDNPSTDPSFANFSYYSGTPEIIVYAHRKPIANATLVWDYDPSARLYKTAWEDHSYDLDHQYSRPDKGVVETKIMYRRNGGEWSYKIPDNLEPGSYELLYYVKDPEGVWSDPFTMNFTLNPAPPMQFEASLRTADSKFNTASIPASEYLQVFNAWTRFPYNVYLTVGLYNGTTLVGPLQRIDYSSSTGVKTDNDIDWNNINYQVPANLTDGTYRLRVTAVGEYDQTAFRDFQVTVYTPVWEDYASGTLRYNQNSIDGVPNTIMLSQDVSMAESNTIQFSTSKYAQKVKVQIGVMTFYAFRNGTIGVNENGSGAQTTFTYNTQTQVFRAKDLTLQDNAYSTTWRFNFASLVDKPLAAEQNNTMSFTAYDASGNWSTTGNKHGTNPQSKNFMTLSMKLENLRIVNIADFAWKNHFVNVNGSPTALKTNGIKTVDMPVYRNAQIKGIKLGYQVNFKVDSVGLNGPGDKLNVNVSFYILDSNNDLRRADVYVPDKSMTSYDLIQTREDYRRKAVNLELDSSFRTAYNADPSKSTYNTWGFGYYLPPTAKVVPRGQALDLYNDKTSTYKLLVCFDIIGIKASNGMTYDYTQMETVWGTGSGSVYGSNRPTNLNLLTKGVNHGEVFWYMLNETSLDDLELNRGW
ncbi:MAG: hypothetical protein N3B21_05110 [Clostridia bacterium]|nr:hypothetical protein [Clostridia bacterium]